MHLHFSASKLQIWLQNLTKKLLKFPPQVILSSLPWHEIFYRLLNRAAEITHHSPDDGELWRFLEATYESKIPEYGSLFHVTWRTGTASNSDFSFLIPHHFSLPSIPDNVSGNWIPWAQYYKPFYTCKTSFCWHQTLASYSSVSRYSKITLYSAFIRGRIVVSDSTQAQL